jgi:hypothetical protein
LVAKAVVCEIKKCAWMSLRMTLEGWKNFYRFGKREIFPGNALGSPRYAKALFEVDFVVGGASHGGVILGLRQPAAALIPQPAAGGDWGSPVPAGWLRKAAAGCTQSKLSGDSFAIFNLSRTLNCAFH